ncbi:MAG: DNA methylase [Lachnospiraceae bacterium]|nr:DNA methylase [Lachnospiraceae bacterium]
MEGREKAYLAIDMKSFYASVECVSRGLDPLKANLIVADESRSDKTIVLAVSPALIAIGVPSRPRLFEAREAVRRYEILHRTRVQYYVAVPRMAEYERVSAQIYSIFLRYAAAEDIHVYSIDESFIDCTPYLGLYEKEAEKSGVHPAHVMAMTMIRAVLDATGITATAGIGTNLYLAKVAMDIVAKKQKADRFGVRIAELNPDSYKFLLWEHRPLTDFWQIGPGKARRLEKAALFTMGQIAEKSLYNEEYFYKTFGIDGEILIDHAWGEEPVTMKDIKNYRPDAHSLSHGQVLARPYEYAEARIVFHEMIDLLCADLCAKGLVSSVFTWWISYDFRSLEFCPSYDGPLSVDFFGRIHPKHSNGTVRLRERSNSMMLISEAMLKQFDEKTDHRLLYRRIGVSAGETRADTTGFQLDLFSDYEALDREHRIQQAMLEVRRKYGKTAVVKGFNLLPGATAMERSMQIGGHRM